MENVTVTKQQAELLGRVFGRLGIGIFLLCLLVSGREKLFSLDAVGPVLIRAVSISMTATGGLFALFQRYLWKWWRFPRWINRPVVAGVWIGRLASDYSGEADKAGPGLIIPIAFVIRQTMTTITIQSFTERQEGESTVEALLLSPRIGQFCLTYVFELKNSYPGKTMLTRGAGRLGLFQKYTRLEGNYWTDSPTHGTLKLVRVSETTDLIETYDDVRAQYPDHAGWTP